MNNSKLSKQIIVDEAMAIIAETGNPEIPLREIARRLGVQAPSLYNHIKNTQELQYAVYQRTIEMIVAKVKNATSGKSKDEAIKAFAEAYYSFAMENKGLYKLIMSIPSKKDETGKEIALPLLDAAISILSDYEMEEEAKAHWQRVLRAILHGFVSQEYLGYFYFYKGADVKDSLAIAIQCFLDGLHKEIGKGNK